VLPALFNIPLVTSKIHKEEGNEKSSNWRPYIHMVLQWFIRSISADAGKLNIQVI
jgi:hypothetical protein